MDDAVSIISSPDYEKHLVSFQSPEVPLRIQTVVEELKKRKLLRKDNLISPRLASVDEICLCHTNEWVQTYQSLSESCTADNPLTFYGPFPGELDICSDSFTTARLAVGGVLKAVEIVMDPTGNVHQVFCAVRPPGHHARPNEGMGFCPFNNVAIGAKFALKNYSEIKNVLIVDWDVHHGNGTEEIFYHDSDVFYFSTHFYGAFYPGTGSDLNVGEGNGLASTLNIPITSKINFKEKALNAFQRILPEKMKEFKPDLVFISAGFDAHVNDPMGAGNLTDEDFFKLTAAVKKIAHQYCDGRLISVLEGGYGTDGTLAKSVAAHVNALQTQIG